MNPSIALGVCIALCLAGLAGVALSVWWDSVATFVGGMVIMLASIALLPFLVSDLDQTHEAYLVEVEKIVGADVELHPGFDYDPTNRGERPGWVTPAPWKVNGEWLLCYTVGLDVPGVTDADLAKDPALMCAHDGEFTSYTDTDNRLIRSPERPGSEPR